MVNDAMSSQEPNLAGEVDSALTELDTALTDARRAIQVIRGSIGQIGELERRMRAMEAAMSRALESLTAPLSGQIAPASQLRPVAAEETKQPIASTEAPARGTTSHCLRLTVKSKSGSLDLKTVDNAVNENLDIVDVALLDYDGREAVLKLWVNPDANVESVRTALIESLRIELGDQSDAEAFVELEEAA